VIRDNIVALDLGDRTTVMSGDVMTRVGQLGPVDVVLVDPPYEFDQWSELLAALAVCTGESALVVAESGKPLGAQLGWEILREKRYGRTWVTFFDKAVQRLTA
jgi:16S rRNA (guanine966-N2)-methyltransferase